MKWYLITYDLNTPGQDYNRLYTQISSISNGCCPILKSAWLIGHDGPAEDIYKQLNSVLDENDHIFITEVTYDCYGSLEKKRAEWVNEYVDPSPH